MVGPPPPPLPLVQYYRARHFSSVYMPSPTSEQEPYRRVFASSHLFSLAGVWRPLPRPHPHLHRGLLRSLHRWNGFLPLVPPLLVRRAQSRYRALRRQPSWVARLRVRWFVGVEGRGMGSSMTRAMLRHFSSLR